MSKELLTDPGLIKWGILGATVVALEVTPGGTLTHYARELQQNPVGRAVAWGVAGYTLAHLMNEIPLPREWDLFYMAGDALDWAKERVGEVWGRLDF